MIKQFKYILAIATTIGSYLGAATTYIPGSELANGTRSDTIRIGSAGGFSGFTNPSRRVKTLYLTFVESRSTPAANTDYTGTNLPTTVDDLWLEGDASAFDTLVSSGALYALPTPAINTTIHFLLSAAPSTSPLTWFKNPLPSGCRLVVEPGSADPFINTVLPLAGGNIIIGAPVAPAVGFSDLLASMTASCLIQRHPNIAAKNTYSLAVMTLAEATTFPYAVNGISLAGENTATFSASSDIIDPSSDSADAGYTVAAHKILTIVGSHAALPGIRCVLEAGGTANIKTTTTIVPLPKLTPSLTTHH
jgi:hypothetical protein